MAKKQGSVELVGPYRFVLYEKKRLEGEKVDGGFRFVTDDRNLIAHLKKIGFKEVAKEPADAEDKN